ncbi:hypothetical protein BU26DRAFT_532613 [Trematosphaeria pertusa]|uniref:Spindle pole body associated protein SnaD n=1 Tax=Trematosphaeria pertusa TaxID=390896 RepID=A0A6A6I701_9PLEO|nr:uncharacterized protein BU26DRAFT_532613 [Trematosphaeria pertusa]KAF2245848.1 hypothetical protein BU26DRAFT_532613 [Trematosphaeria pertusa]
MARTHSSYTASPTRWRSPQRSPARQQTSEEGSQYEMDLDALGLNSTFESTEVDEEHQPKVDVVDTSDIEGPEDFTMNMTYWMTADLPAAQQIRSRKEANVRVAEVRGDALQETDGAQDTTAEGDRALIEDSSRDREVEAGFHSASPTMRANGTENGRSSSKAPSEAASMENEEKVRSYLSALPDTDIGPDALTSTPLRVPKKNMLQVPSPAAPRARSLQATVEDYDTPRKPTQETVIHHPQQGATKKDIAEEDALRKQVAELQSRLEQQELASKTRITELETILSFTRSELDTARSEGYKQKERISALERHNQEQKKNLEVSRASLDGRLKAQEEELNARMQEFGEELRLQNLAKLQNQREDFERQLRASEQAKRAVDEVLEARGQLLEEVQGELSQLRRSHEQKLQGMKNADSEGQQLRDNGFSKERSKADTLQADLERATAEARSAHEEAQANAALHTSAQQENEARSSHIREVESRLESLQSQLSFAQADVAAKDERLRTMSGLQSRLQSLQSQLDASRTDAAAKNQQFLRSSDLDSRLQSLQRQLDSARTDATAKDWQILQQIEEQERYEQRLNTAQGRIEGLETTVSTLRQQLAEAHRDSAKARTDAERSETDWEEANDRLQEARKLSKMKESKADAESQLKILQSQHDKLVEDHEAQLEDVREKAEDARTEKKRIMKELKKTSKEFDQVRAEAAQKASEEDASLDDSSSLSLSSSQVNAKDAEIENLRTLLRKQAATLKSLKSETSTLRKENTRLKALEIETTSATISTLQTELSTLRTENETLKADIQTRKEDFEAVNKAMDERLAGMLSKALKERARTVVGKRDGQWVESIGKVRDEREFMGKVLMREWGRQEVGVAREELGERQGYRYQFVKRS